MPRAPRLGPLMILALGLCWAAGSAYAVAATTGDPQSASALYDAGNGYARQGRAALAILYYERARLLAPTDPDILANLRHVRASAGLPPGTGTWWASHARVANPNIMFLVGVFALGLAGAGVLVIRFHSRLRRAGWIAAVSGAVLLGVALDDALATWPIMHEAVVLHGTAVRASPVAGGDSLFTIPEGQVVNTMDNYHGFELISTDAGRTGWVQQADVAAVVARRSAEF